jgi:GNAT superfamily N-acetyltransferase
MSRSALLDSSPMWIGEIDPRDGQVMRNWWEAAKEGDAFERPYAAFWSLQAATVAMTAENNPMEQHPLAAIDDAGAVLGTNQVMLPRIDNTHVALMTPIVRPPYRRQGIGSALLDAGLDLARSRGRTTVLIEVNQPATDTGPGDNGGSRLLTDRGFATASLELHRVLDLPVSGQRLDELEAEAGPHHDGYTMVALGSRVPPELMDGYCALQAAFNTEAPLGDLDLEPEVWTLERVRQAEERFEKQGRHQRGMAAVAADGAMVALTEMMTTTHSPEFAWQGGTLVLKEHRGHRLGLAVKVANLRAFQAEFPDARIVHSWNAEENGPMVAINDRLGFRPVEYVAEMQLRL